MDIKVNISMKQNCSKSFVSILRYLVSPEGPPQGQKEAKMGKIPKL
jgi:hypothetical protein